MPHRRQDPRWRFGRRLRQHRWPLASTVSLHARLTVCDGAGALADRRAHRRRARLCWRCRSTSTSTIDVTASRRQPPRADVPPASGDVASADAALSASAITVVFRVVGRSPSKVSHPVARLTDRRSSRAPGVPRRRSRSGSRVHPVADAAAGRRVAAHRRRRAHAHLRPDRVGQNADCVPGSDRPAGHHANPKAHRTASFYISPLRLGVDIEKNPPRAAHRHRSAAERIGVPFTPRRRDAHRRHAFQ